LREVIAMAKPGDGAARSETRKLTATISLRIAADEKLRLEAIARRSHFPSLSAWIFDQLRKGHGSDIGMRQRRILCGHLGQIGAQLNALARGDVTTDPDHLQHLLHRIGTDIASLQRLLMDDDHAGEDDP
jgi:hypothetical protein